MIEIDGAKGEAGGQIVRTAVALSTVTQRPFYIFNIRKGRREPGLKLQHLAAVNAVADLCQAKVENAKLGSQEIWFYPGEIQTKDLNIRIESAGSIALVLQSLFIALANNKEKIEIDFHGGGTHGKWAPTIGYLSHVFLPMVTKFGHRINSFQMLSLQARVSPAFSYVNNLARLLCYSA